MEKQNYYSVWPKNGKCMQRDTEREREITSMQPSEGEGAQFP